MTRSDPPAPVRRALFVLSLTLVGSAGFMAGPGRAPVTAIVAVVVFGALLLAIARRKNWARLVFAACFLVGLLFAVALLPVQFRQAPLFAWVSIVQNVLFAFGVGLLFRRDAREWYRVPARAAA